MKQDSGNGDLFVDAEDIAEGVADFAQGCVGLYRLEDVGHEVILALRGFAQPSEAARDLIVGAFGAQFAQALGLATCHSFIDLQSVQRLFVTDEKRLYAAPITMPTASTMTPPSTIWNTAWRNGVSIYRARMKAIAHNSKNTTTPAIAVAIQNALGHESGTR